MTDEKHLVQASLAGDSRAFERLVEKYQAMICAITFSATGKVDISEELAQETFLRAWKNLAQLKNIEKFRFWLCSIARNLLRTYYQQKHDKKISVCDIETLETLATQHVQSPTDTLISREEEMILSQALMQIPEEYREPLVLFYRQQQSTKEVAESLELNEATVRTRLHRGRQMLKDQVAVTVERTLEKTGPSKKFTKAVMVAIGGGLAAGTAATAKAVSANFSTAAGGASAVLTGVGIKVAAIAAAVIIGTGAMVYYYWNPSSQEEKTIQTVIIEPTRAETKQETAIPKEPITAIAENTTAPQTSPQNRIEKTPAPSQPKFTSQPATQPTIRHPNWPAINEPLKNIYVETKSAGIDSGQEVQKFWARIPDTCRDETTFEYITMDNAKQRFLWDSNIAIFDGKRVWPYQKLLEELRMMEIIRLFRDPNPNPKYTLIKQSAKSGNDVILYHIKENDNQLRDPNTFFVQVWVDQRTQLPEKMVSRIVREPNQFDNFQNGTFTFDFSPIPDRILSIKSATGGVFLPPSQPITFSGQVIDLLGQPVAGAEVYLNCRTLEDGSVYQDVSDTNGNFVILLPLSDYHVTDSFSSILSLWAKLPDTLDFFARILLQDSWNSHLDIIMPGSPGIVYSSEVYRIENIKSGGDGIQTTKSVSTTYGNWCVGASDIILVMEPANKVFGWIQDTQGNAVPNATINISLGSIPNQDRSENPVKHTIPTDIFTTQSNQQGYYESNSIPKLWNKCTYTINVIPPNDGLFGDTRTIPINDPNQPVGADFILLSQGVTVRGIVKDNYETPLSERYICVQVNGKEAPEHQTRTDKNGRFELKNCPAIKDLQIRAALSRIQEKINGQNIHHEYYPDITANIGYRPGQNEYEVKLVAIKPEIEIEAVLTDSAGNPLPYFPVEIRTLSVTIPLQYRTDRNLYKRTDEKGYIQFQDVPEIKTLYLLCSVFNLVTNENQTPQMQQYFKQLKQDYQKYHWTEAEVPLEPGQKKYQMNITIPTEEEYKQQKELEKSQSDSQGQ
jgi:RNA polymerase sigma factor (sigma-70 family)